MIDYVTGDATKPTATDGLRVIAHIVNDQHGWGSGFVVALSKRWPQPEAHYRAWGGLTLGEVQVVPVKDEHGRLYVANMAAQHKYVSEDNPVALDYGALVHCLTDLKKWIDSLNTVKMGMDKTYLPNASIHMPRIGCGLAGGNWDVVEPIIGAILGDYHRVIVYDLPKNKERNEFDNFLKDVREKKI